VHGLVAAGMVVERPRAANCDLSLTESGTTAIARLTDARRRGLTELLEGWNPEEHPEVIEMVKELAHALLADDQRLVADALAHPIGAGAAGGAATAGGGAGGGGGGGVTEA
jgi:hypothetical protein